LTTLFCKGHGGGGCGGLSPLIDVIGVVASSAGAVYRIGLAMIDCPWGNGFDEQIFGAK
jgi:hypothetical protein